jgi:SAM-dependent methyltransferase
MNLEFFAATKKVVKRIALRCGLKIERARRSGSTNGYIPAVETEAAAKKAGLSILDYVEYLWNEKGLTRYEVERIVSVCRSPESILEIGPGTGRYIELLLQHYKPVRYEVYETALDWADYLKRTYPYLTHHEADGFSLSHTKDASIDLAQAHGVFDCVPFLTTYRYLLEIDRVTRPGAYVVFDVITERCMDEASIAKWLSSEHRYPVVIPTSLIEDFFVQRSFRLVDRFVVKYGEGLADYFIFTKM